MGDAAAGEPEAPVVRSAADYQLAADPEKCSSPPAVTATGAAGDLADIRRRHQEKFLQREAAAQKEEEERARREENEEQQRRDEELARQFAKDDEEAQLRQLEADEEYSRQLAEQMYGGAPGGNVPMHSFSGSDHSDVPLDDSDTEGQYHQMEDDEGYRQPMRTGYTDRLIDPPHVDAGRSAMQFPPLLAGMEIDDLLDQARMSSIIHRRDRAARWKMVLVWASLTLITVALTWWVMFGMHDGAWQKAVHPRDPVDHLTSNRTMNKSESLILRT